MTVRSWLVAWAVVIFAAPGWAGESLEESVSPYEPYEKLYTEWEEKAKPLKRGSVERRELNQHYTHHFYELAKEHSKNEDVWVQCLIWTYVEGVPGDDLDGMMELMQKHANQVSFQTQLQLSMSELIPIESKKLNPALEEIAKTNRFEGIRGGALYALAARTTLQAEREGSVEKCEIAKALLKKVIQEYPKVSTYRGENIENAEPMLKRLEGPLALGQVAPDSTGQTLTGEDFQLAKLRGKVVVLVFSASWCGPCAKMHSYEKALVEKLPADKYAFVEINVDDPEGLTKVKQTMEEEGLVWEVVTDGPDGPLVKKWDVSAYPTFYVLDHELRIRHRSPGFLGDKLEQWVTPLVQKMTPQP